MQYSPELESLLQNLEKVTEKRQEFAGYLKATADEIEQTELEGAKTSSQLFLENELKDLQTAIEKLESGCFRILVLGDVKRGKSTFNNVLLGKNLLPNAVNPCTAVLTIIRYGEQEQVTVYFKDGNGSETLSFEEFREKYTIPPEEAKKYEDSGESAFPHVSHAVVDYPLELLKNGVEIVDSPGLNDTEDRNELTLGYINNCHAIIFVLNAVQAVTMGERRYLENYLNDRGLTIFFLLNQWDRIRDSLLDPEDPNEVYRAEKQVRQVFANNLEEYCQIDGRDLYQERVFEISARNALQKALKGKPLDGTGMPEFLSTLEKFLTRERVISEFRQVCILMRQVYQDLHESVERRIPLLGQDIEELKSRIASVQPEFEQLRNIRDEFREKIQEKSEESADLMAQSAHNFFGSLDQTFESDFQPYMPSLKLWDFLFGGKQKRKDYEKQIIEGFNKYINDKFAQWSKSAEKDLRSSCDNLAITAMEYGIQYQGVTDKINADLTGKELRVRNNESQAQGQDKELGGWGRFAVGATAFIVGDYVGAAAGIAGTGYNWKSLLTNIILVLVTNMVLSAVFHVVLGPAGVLAILAASSFKGSADLHKAFIKKMREMMKAELPKMADEAATNIYKEIRQLFTNYEEEVIARINSDIDSRSLELERLSQQKQKSESERQMEISQLNQLKDNVYTQVEKIQTSFDSLVGGAV